MFISRASSTLHHLLSSLFILLLDMARVRTAHANPSRMFQDFLLAWTSIVVFFSHQLSQLFSRLSSSSEPLEANIVNVHRYMNLFLLEQKTRPLTCKETVLSQEFRVKPRWFFAPVRGAPEVLQQQNNRGVTGCAAAFRFFFPFFRYTYLW